ncbi:MAG TPA: 2OG-Fe(II) oxygenase [Xanthomonadaceae bacterium]|nr:2OG-Fe(II) oxygenase [Xanthomonadaceae bacterium]
MFDPARLTGPASTVLREPFPILVAQDQLAREAADALARDFPRYGSAGFFPYDPADCGDSVRALVDALTAPAFADAIGDALGVHGLGRYPTLVTLCQALNRRHGTIHTDSQSKVATALVYLNPGWPDTSGGCLRFLRRIDDIDALVLPEIRPLYGTLAAFRRTANSFHGHLPYEGERRVVQVAWLTSDEEKLRKTRRGGLSRLVKRVAGAADRRFGSGRDRNARHED